jgi:hypothetical protein
MRLLLIMTYTVLSYVVSAQSGDHADFIFNYYGQEGDHSAVTGGLGTQELEDFSLDVHVQTTLDSAHYLVWTAHANYYTSASTDRIDFIMSSASSEDVRLASFMGIGKEKETTDYGGGLGGSIESDYVSFQAAFWWNKSFKKGRQLGVRFDQFFDTWIPYFPSEIRGTEQATVRTEKRRTSDLLIQYSFPLNYRSKLGLIVNPAWQNGLNSTPFHRVYFTDSDMVDIERLPKDRLMLPLALQWNIFLSPNFASRFYYRYFLDNFGQRAHSVQWELPVKLNPYWTLRPFYRYHIQTASNYFKPYREHSLSDPYYTSDWDFGKFNSHKAGVSIQYYPLYPLWDALQWVELRYLIYRRSDGLRSQAFSLGTRLNF